MNFQINIKTPEPVFRQIERFLKGQIRERTDDEGFRLPPTSELAAKWGVSCATIDKAMKVLAADGLVERRCKRGTFLKSNIDKGVVGILVGHRLTDETSHFQRALLEGIQAEIMDSHDGRWTCYAYDGLSGLKNDDDFSKSASHQRLMRDFREQSFLAQEYRVFGRESAQQVSQAPDLGSVQGRLPRFVRKAHGHERRRGTGNDFSREKG